MLTAPLAVLVLTLASFLQPGGQGFRRSPSRVDRTDGDRTSNRSRRAVERRAFGGCCKDRGLRKATRQSDPSRRHEVRRF